MRYVFNFRKPANAVITGMLAGQLVWALAFLAAVAGLGVPFNVVAAPIGVVGYLLVWGDNGPPEWAQQHLIHVAFGLLFYGAVGAGFGLVYWSLNTRPPGPPSSNSVR